MRRGRGDVIELDELDNRLLQELAVDPRISNVALASKVGTTDETVAARLRKMLEGGVLAMTALIDWEAAGFGAHGFVRVRLESGPPSDVARILSRDPSAHLVAVTTGACDVVVGLLGRDISALRARFIAMVRSLPAAVSASLSVVTEPCRHGLQATTLPIEEWSPDLMPDPRIPLDDLDRRLIGLLITHAHESNRWLARRLGSSDGTIRARLQRLEDAGFLRIAAVADTVTTGEVRSAAFVFVEVVGDDGPAVAALVGHRNIGTLDRCVGGANLVAIVTAGSENEMHTFVAGDLRRLPGVRRVEVAPVLEAARHRSSLVRLLPLVS